MTSPSADLVVPGAGQNSHWSTTAAVSGAKRTHRRQPVGGWVTGLYKPCRALLLHLVLEVLCLHTVDKMERGRGGGGGEREAYTNPVMHCCFSLFWSCFIVLSIYCR